QASRAGRSVLWAGQREGDLTSDVRAKEFLAEKPPVAAVAFGNDGIQSHIGPALPFGHPLSRRPCRRRVARGEMAQGIRRLAVSAVGEHAGGAVGHGDRTQVGRGGRGEEVTEGSLHQPRSEERRVGKGGGSGRGG